MTFRTVIKLILVGVMTVCAVISVFVGMVSEHKVKKKNQKQMTADRTVVKVRLTCFLIMMVSLFICVVL